MCILEPCTAAWSTSKQSGVNTSDFLLDYDIGWLGTLVGVCFSFWWLVISICIKTIQQHKLQVFNSENGELDSSTIVPIKILIRISTMGVGLLTTEQGLIRVSASSRN
jgi:hypothetical protein